MKIWTDTLNQSDLARAAAYAGVTITSDISPRGVTKARRRAYRFDIALSGHSPHAQGNGSGLKGATWDEWGIFLNQLFEMDDNLATQYYADANAFHTVTGWRFEDLLPQEQHKRHKWEFAGTRCFTCECGATQRQLAA